MVEQVEEKMQLIERMREEYPASRTLVVPEDAVRWTPEELGLFFRTNGLLKPLLTPWSSGNQQKITTPKREPEAQPKAMEQPPIPKRRLQSPQEYAMAVQQQGRIPRPEPALIIPAADDWLSQLQHAAHLIPFEAHSPIDATSVMRPNENWSLSTSAALAKGVDLRLFYDSLSFKSCIPHTQRCTDLAAMAG